MRQLNFALQNLYGTVYNNLQAAPIAQSADGGQKTGKK